MGSLKALQEWCRLQCRDYSGVDIRDMAASFRDGLAFCAIIHRHRPDLLDFDSLSKENVYENNRLAFEVAESELGIPALLDPEDMVSMKVPDRLSIITYVSQYYNFFNNKSQANPPSMKRLGSGGRNEPSPKKPAAPPAAADTEHEQAEAEAAEAEAEGEVVKRSSPSSICSACQKHVHLVQRFLVDGKLFHRNCFRCMECRSTLLPGSYRLENHSGSLVCSHHLKKQNPFAQNGAPRVEERTTPQSVRLGRSPVREAAAAARAEQEETIDTRRETKTSCSESAALSATSETDTSEVDVNREMEVSRELDGGGGVDESREEDVSREVEDEKPRPSSPPNPFDESDEDEEKDEVTQTPAPSATNGPESRPVPAPRRVSEPVAPPRPAPRFSKMANDQTVDRTQKPPILPKPRERSQSPKSSAHRPKDPPWLALVKAEQRRKKAAPPPPPGPPTPANTGSLSSLQGEGAGPGSPPPPHNPFEDDEDENDEESGAAEEEGGDPGSVLPPAVVASHPWYRITHSAEGTPEKTSSSRSASPGSGKSKKRPAPPPPPGGDSALSTESLSSGSEHGPPRQRPPGATCSGQEQSFTKSVSEPSICSPLGDSHPSLSPRSDGQHHSSPYPDPYTPSVPENASSAPATPQTSRNTDGAGHRAPPPRPPSTPSLQVGQSPQKRTCKENPFNRKASPAPAKAATRPHRGPRPPRPPAPGHGFPLIKRKVQSDEYIPVEDIHGEMAQLEQQLDALEHRGVELEAKLRGNPNDEDEERLLVDWFTLIHDKHLLVRREAELVYTAKQQNLEERQADVEYELRCLLNKPEKDWSDEDKSREQELMSELVTIIEQRNQIVNSMDQDRQREEEEDKLMEAMLKKKDFNKELDSSEQQRKKGAKFKPIKVLKRLSHKGDAAGKSPSPRKDKS